MSEEKKIIVYDSDAEDFIEMTMDEDDYQAMVEYEKQIEFEEYERRQKRNRDDR